MGDRGQAVGVVIGVTGSLAILVGGGGTATARIISELSAGASGVSDRSQAVQRIVGKGSLILQRVDHRDAVSVGVVLIVGCVLLRVLDGGNQIHGSVGERRNVAEWFG